MESSTLSISGLWGHLLPVCGCAAAAPELAAHDFLQLLCQRHDNGYIIWHVIYI